MIVLKFETTKLMKIRAIVSIVFIYVNTSYVHEIDGIKYK